MINHTFTRTSAYVPLNQLLKILGIGENGSDIKAMITEWLIYVNGKQEFRIRNKLVGGDVVTFPTGDITITVE